MQAEFDEVQADNAVIKSLMNEILRLKEKTDMILTDNRGKFYRVRREKAHVMTDQEVADALAEAQAEEAMLSSAATAPSQPPAPADQPTAPAQPQDQAAPDPNLNQPQLDANGNPIVPPVDASQPTPPQIQ